MSQPPSSTNPFAEGYVPPPEQKCSPLTENVKWLAGIFAITAIVVAILGALVLFGQLHIAFENVGTMTRYHGAYLMLGGLGAFTLDIAWIILHSLDSFQCPTLSQVFAQLPDPCGYKNKTADPSGWT